MSKSRFVIGLSSLVSNSYTAWELGKKGRSGNDMQGVAGAANGASLTLLK